MGLTRQTTCTFYLEAEQDFVKRMFYGGHQAVTSNGHTSSRDRDFLVLSLAIKLRCSGVTHDTTRQTPVLYTFTSAPGVYPAHGTSRRHSCLHRSTPSALSAPGGRQFIHNSSVTKQPGSLSGISQLQVRFGRGWFIQASEWNTPMTLTRQTTSVLY